MAGQGFDAAKKVTGRKRYILVDTLGLLLSVAVHPAGIQDRDGAALVLTKRTRALFPFILRIFADAGYRGPRVASAAANTGSWIVGSLNVPWPGSVVTGDWRGVFERYATTVVGFIRLATIRVMLRRMTRSTACL